MMKDKVLVEVLVPASGDKFDVFIPLEIRMSEANGLVAAALNDLSKGKYIAKEDAVLCDASTGNIFDINKFVAELGIQNGSRLVLI